MSYPASVDTGGIAEQILECPGLELAAGGATGTVGAGTVYLYLVKLDAQTIVTNMRTHCGGTAAGAVLDMGVYSLDGTTLLAHTGPVTGTAGATISPALLANVTLPPGFYWLAFSDNSGSNVYSRAGTLAVPGALSSIRVATNTYSGGLPTTLGALLAPASAIPVWSGVALGGLP